MTKETKGGSGDGWGKVKAGGGDTIVTPYGLDKSSYDVKGGRGGSMGGSITNLSHSLPGSTPKQKGV